MKINLNNSKRIAGELAARYMSEKAQSVFLGSEATLWEYEDDDDNKLYALNLTSDNPAGATVGLTFEEAQEQLEANAVWYAILMDEDDTDWGTGFWDYKTALKEARERGYKYIATILDGPDPICESIEEV